ncbi:MAG: alpha/beta fold hydrolase [Acidobacteria bacterium]|nr:alpha/beta fold hydrolase [Acidobacteriota bacterium]
MLRKIPSNSSFTILSVALFSLGACWGWAGTELRSEQVTLKAEDGGRSNGAFYWAEGQSPRIAVVLMHPIGDSRTSWVAQGLAREGLATLGMAGRYTNDEMFHIHEELLLDIAAAVRFLKQEKKMEKVVFFGHSGGGQLGAFYQSQAATPPPGRLTSTPGGDPPDLNELDLPPLDGLICSNAHEGRGVRLMNSIDPSVADENDPFSVKPELDMYNPDNGFRLPPASSKYSEAFLKKYRAAQVERIKRIDARAHAIIEEERRYQELMKKPDFKDRPLKERLEFERRAQPLRLLTVYRKVAEPKYTDLSIDPSDRPVGTNQAGNSFRPDLLNYSNQGVGLVISPRAWLSSRSGLSARTDLRKNLKKVTIPLLIIAGSADMGNTPEAKRKDLESAAGSDKQLVLIPDADHGYMPLKRDADLRHLRPEHTRGPALQALSKWIKDHFPAEAQAE